MVGDGYALKHQAHEQAGHDIELKQEQQGTDRQQIHLDDIELKQEQQLRRIETAKLRRPHPPDHWKNFKSKVIHASEHHVHSNPNPNPNPNSKVIQASEHHVYSTTHEKRMLEHERNMAQHVANTPERYVRER